jgi:membrane-associated protease RseP (regulator of RpoE activity)
MEQPAHWPAPQVAQPPTSKPLIHVLLLITTILTTTVAGAFSEGLDPIRNPALLIRGLPFAGTLVTILLVHESGHYLMCLRHKVSATLPYFLPAPPNISFIGTFGAFIRIRSRFPDRRALFDIGAAGPWAGFVVALIATAVGLRLSTVLPVRPEGATIELGDSLLTAFLVRVLLNADPSSVVLHPVAFAGWFGLFVTSINLLPVGQLDGGHVLYAASGRVTRLVPALLLGFLVWLGIHGWAGWFLWAAIITLLVSLGHPPTENDWRPLGTGRILAAVATLVVFVLTFVAEPFRIVP